MSDIFREVEDALKEDRAKALWKKYGTWLITLAIVIVLAVGGFVWWQNYSRGQLAQQGADLVLALTLAQQDEQAGIDALASLAQESAGDVSALARINSASLMANTGDVEGAVLLFRTIAGEGDVSPVWRDLALLLAAQHSVDSAPPEEILAELEALTQDSNAWRHSARELTALLAMRQGDDAEALRIYEALRDDDTAPEGLRNRATAMAALLAE